MSTDILREIASLLREMPKAICDEIERRQSIKVKVNLNGILLSSNGKPRTIENWSKIVIVKN